MGYVTIYLISDDKSLPVRTPGQSESVTKSFYFINDCLRTDIPEFYDTVAADTAQLGVLHGIESDFLNASCMAFKVGRMFYTRKIGIPTAKMSEMCTREILVLTL
jgi:hypothetical protein